MKEDKSIFLKVDGVDPVYDISPCSYSWISGGAPHLKGINVWIGGKGHFFPCDRYIFYDPDVVREDAYRQAFALMREVYDMTASERREAFGKIMLGEVLRDASYDDLAKKLDTWKIHVRDEVYSQTHEVRFVVTKIVVPSGGEDAVVNGLKKDGAAVKGLLLCNLKKTGLHVDDLDAYLEV